MDPTYRGRVLSKWLVSLVITNLPGFQVSVQWVITRITTHLLSTLPLQVVCTKWATIKTRVGEG